MSSKRIFVAGLGVGIIVGALLLQLVYAAQTDISIAQDERLYTEAEVAELLAAAKREALPSPTPTPSSTPTDKPSPLPTELDTDLEQSAQGLNNEEINGEQVNTYLEVRILPGATLTDSANLLVENKVISDSEKFVALMKKDNKQVRAGWFSFHEGMTEEEVVKIVTSKPLSKDD